MKKKEALKYIRENVGYVPYISLFEIYKDNDEIPQHLITMCCKKDKPVGNFVVVNSDFAQIFNNIINENIKN